MSGIDLETLSAALSPEAPSGENLEYDAAFGELERAAAPKEASQFDDEGGDERSWSGVMSQALDLLGRTHDVRVAVYLARASLRSEGYAGFADTLTLIARWFEAEWDSVHPELDADDDNDPMFRLNALAGLKDPDETLLPLRRAHLVESRGLGRFSLRSLDIAAGRAVALEGETVPEQSAIDGAFLEVDIDALVATQGAVARATESLNAIMASLDEKLGPGSIDLSPIEDTLGDAARMLAERLAARGHGEAPAAMAGDEGEAESAASSAAASGPVTWPAELRSREEVTRALDLAVGYFRKYEPTSPVPLLIERARKLIPMDFMEIVRDLAPDGLSQVELFKGRERDDY